jgi:hypothetical protein
LESPIYVEAGDLSCDAGGLLLVLRKHSTLYLLYLLQTVFQPLARLSKALQTSMGNMSSAMSLARATVEGIEECDFAALAQEASDAKEVIVSAGVNIEEDFILRNSEQIGKKFVYLITEILKARFSDEVSQLCTLQDILKEKSTSVNWKPFAKLLKVPAAELVSEWKFLRWLSVDLSSTSEMLALVTSADKIAAIIRRLLLLPIGTATVERSFSTLKRILCSKRCRLNTEHVQQLMKIAIEGPQVPDAREVEKQDKENG